MQRAALGMALIRGASRFLALHRESPASPARAGTAVKLAVGGGMMGGSSGVPDQT